jgi:hypothetical protein
VSHATQTVALRACKDCGVEYEPWNNWKSPGMAYRRCNLCYLAYTRKRQTPSGGWKAREHADAEFGVSPRPARWRKIRAEVLASETHCGFCNEWVDQSLPYTHRMGPTVDHILPIACGGATYDRSDLRLAHRACNSAGAVAVQAERLSMLRAALWIGSRL